MENGGGQRVFFKCKYCNVFFDTAASLVAHKRFEHADQIFVKSPSNNKSDWDPIRSQDKKSPTKICVNSPSVLAGKNKRREERPGPSIKVFKMPGIPRKCNSDENTRLKCRFCPMALASTQKLHAHERIHTGEKPFQCQHCLKGFIEKSAAESHEKKCPILDILKSGVKKEETKRENGLKVAPRNGFKTKLEFAHSASSSSNRVARSSYLMKRISYTRNFRCPICTKNFKNAWSLSRHKNTHERSQPVSKNPIECFPILKTEKVPFLPQLLKCIGSQGQVNFSCQKCTKRLATKCSGLVHLRTHFGANIFTCPVCNKQFSTLKEIVAHFSSHPSSITSALQDAAEISAYITRFFWATRVSIRHEDTDNHYTEQEDTDRDRKVFKCNLCHFKILSKPGLTRVSGLVRRMRLHIRRKHIRSNLYTCDECHRGYVQKWELLRHSCKRKPGKAVKVKIEGFKCPLCAIVFDNKGSLAVHNDGHSKMPFLCVKCGLWFRRAPDIKGHLVDCAK